MIGIKLAINLKSKSHNVEKITFLRLTRIIDTKTALRENRFARYAVSY
jgi:hypothetical protein